MQWASGWNSRLLPGRIFKSQEELTQELEKVAAAEGLAEHFKSEEHPFAACMKELAKDYPDEERRKKICGKTKHLIED